MPDLPAVLTDVTIHVVDAAAPYAEMPPNVHLAAFGRPYTGPDWRFEVTWPDGSETCFHAGATADAVALVVNEQIEDRRA